MKSKLYKLNKKLFRYDFDHGVVECIQKADKEMLADDEKWKKEHCGCSLYGIGDDGYMVLAAVGLHSSYWKDKAARDEYLSAWIEEQDAEDEVLVKTFMKYELPYFI